MFSMFNFICKMIRVLSFITLLLYSVRGDVEVWSKLNPGCPECSTDENIVVLVKTPIASNDTLLNHQIWDFSGEIPSVLFFIGNNNKSSVDIVWEGNKPTQIVTNNTYYSFGLMLHDVVEYNDSYDKGYLDDEYSHRDIPLRDVTWRVQQKSFDVRHARAVLAANLSYELHGINGTVEIELVVNGMTGVPSRAPRMLVASGSALAAVSLAGLAPSPCPLRYALRYTLASVDRAAAGPLVYRVRHSIDDEYTPGTFEMIDMMTPRADGGATAPPGYVHMRPIAYTTRGRLVADSVRARVRVRDNCTKLPEESLAGRYYGALGWEPFAAEVVISFGECGDGYYTQSNFTTFSYVVGYGSPPVLSPSMLVLAAAGAAAVLPAAALCTACLAARRALRLRRERLRERAA